MARPALLNTVAYNWWHVQGTSNPQKNSIELSPRCFGGRDATDAQGDAHPSLGLTPRLTLKLATPPTITPTVLSQLADHQY